MDNQRGIPLTDSEKKIDFNRSLYRQWGYLFILFFICMLVPAGLTGAEEEAGFRSLFDGKTLNGWSAPDMRYWSVRDGAITAESSEALPCKRKLIHSFR